MENINHRVEDWLSARIDSEKARTHYIKGIKKLIVQKHSDDITVVE